MPKSEAFRSRAREIQSDLPEPIVLMEEVVVHFMLPEGAFDTKNYSVPACWSDDDVRRDGEYFVSWGRHPDGRLTYMFTERTGTLFCTKWYDFATAGRHLYNWWPERFQRDDANHTVKTW